MKTAFGIIALVGAPLWSAADVAALPSAATLLRGRSHKLQTSYSDVDMDALHYDLDSESIKVPDSDREVRLEEPEIVAEEDQDDQDHRHLVDCANDSCYGLSAIQADQVVPLPDPNLIKVCVVDSGYDNDHVDLPVLNETTDGSSTVSGEDWFTDERDHGTRVAGIIAALDNEEGILGVFPNVSLYIAKAIPNDGQGDINDVMDAVAECIDNGARVINLSLTASTSIKDHKQYFKEKYQDEANSVLFVACAGNDGGTSKKYPASYPAVMSVAGTDSNNDLYSNSQRNNQVEISAPGVDIWSAKSGGHYAKSSGTSYATAYVSGVAALLWSHNPSCTAQQVRRILLASALSLQDANGSDCNDSFGRGLVQAKAAVDMLQQGDCGAADHLPLLSTTGLNKGTCANYTLPPTSSVPTPAPTPETTSVDPSVAPTVVPSIEPSTMPSQTPSTSPTKSMQPSDSPSTAPTDTPKPSLVPPRSEPALSSVPSETPTSHDYETVSPVPSTSPSQEPSLSSMPSIEPTQAPSNSPNTEETLSPAPSIAPTEEPSLSSMPSTEPSETQSNGPTTKPSFQPTMEPSPGASAMPSALPSALPTATPSLQPSQPPSPGAATGSWTNITYDNFEIGWGNFLRLDHPNGGKDTDAHRIANNPNQEAYIPSGVASLRIRDNSGIYSSVFLDASYDVSSYSKLRVHFLYYPRSMENSEAFFLEYSSDNGSSWAVLKQYVNNVDFTNGVDDEDTVEFDPSSEYAFTTEAKIRFRNDASGNGDYIYIDEVSFQGFTE